MTRRRTVVVTFLASASVIVAVVGAAVAWDAGWPPPVFGDKPMPIATLPHLSAGTAGATLAHPFAPGANVSMKTAATSPDGRYRLEAGWRSWGRWYTVSLVVVGSGERRELLAVREADEHSGAGFDWRWSVDSMTAYILGQGRFVGNAVHPLCFAYDVARETLFEAATCVDLTGRSVTPETRRKP